MLVCHTVQILRVFYDRLVDHKDRVWFLSFMRQTLSARFNADLDKIFKHLIPEGKTGEITVEEVRSLFFGDYCDANSGKQSHCTMTEATSSSRQTLHMAHELEMVLFVCFTLSIRQHGSMLPSLPSGSCFSLCPAYSTSNPFRFVTYLVWPLWCRRASQACL